MRIAIKVTLANLQVPLTKSRSKVYGILRRRHLRAALSGKANPPDYLTNSLRGLALASSCLISAIIFSRRRPYST